MKLIKGVLIAACTALCLNVAQGGLLVSEKEVRREARVNWMDMKRHLPLAQNTRVQSYVECVADRIISVLPEEQKRAFDWEVVVFDDDQINAFADPNGKIGVFSALLRVADTPDALAAVLGHEIAHATENHVMERERAGARTNMLVLLGSAATGISPGVLNEGATVGLTLPYARDKETEADLVGLRYMAKAGFDPRAAMYLWKNMSAANGRAAPPEFLSTHPADDTRLDNIVKAITPALVQYNTAREAGQRPNCQPAR
jgi:predicted Zn-dependent protease